MTIEKLRFIAYNLYREGNRDILEDSLALGFESRRVLDTLITGEKQNVSVDFVRQWYAITKDTRILDAMLEGTGYLAIKARKGTRKLDLYRELLQNHEALSDISRSLEQAMEDGKLDKKEIDRLMELSRVNRREAADIHQTLRSMMEDI